LIPRRTPSPAALAHGSAAIGCALLLCAVGQPIFTDDLWWHLALGREFAAHGPWLAEDPLLFAPAGPPSPASWLSDVALAGAADAVGWNGLRLLHIALVAAILALAWSQLRRASRSPALASLGTTAFAALAAYRLVQLRPDLVSIGASLLFYRWLLADERPPGWRRVAAIAAIAALWANAHAGFPLGLLLIGAASGGLVLAAPLRTPEQRRGDRARAQRLAAALGLATLATLVNPTGVGAHLAYFAAGTGTPALDRVVDEWAPVHLFALPAPPLLPSPLAWALVWAILLGVGVALARTIGAARRRSARDPDPALIAVSLLAIGLLLSAVRFLWLGIFPLLLFASALRMRAGADHPSTPRRRDARVAAAVCALLVVGFLRWGDWPAITRGLPATWSGYARPYPASKYYAHAIWLLADSGVRGHLYGDYFLGGFAGYWLAPEIRGVINGTLNVRSETLGALDAIAARRGQRPGEDFASLLDRLGVDLFLGIRLPEAGVPGRRWIATTAHLEDTPGWIPIFRNLESALYLRANERSGENLDRLARYYAEQGVPFDRARGFEVDAVLRDAPEWATRHGVVPSGFLRMARGALTSGATRDSGTRDRVAALYAVLGRYERAAALDRRELRAAPEAVRARRRLVWSLLRMERFEEAAATAAPLEAQPEADGLSHAIAKAAREIGALDAAEVRALVAKLPFLSRAETSWLLAGRVQPAPRPTIH